MNQTLVLDSDATIVAIASATTPAARGIVRLSGEEVTTVLANMGIEVPTVRRPTRFSSSLELSSPVEPKLGEVRVDVLFWPTRRSYTGQPSAELHTIGSLPILQAIVQHAVSAGAQTAKPGEFTMRAFLAGQLDLTQAEAVLGVIEADDGPRLQDALAQLAGNLSEPIEHLRSDLLDLLADVEAGLDFVDEDIQFISDSMIEARCIEILQHLQTTICQLSTRASEQDEFVVVLRGLPNAGKSRLLNCLVERDAAIVTSIPGTTRDALDVSLKIDDHPIRMVDTAGLEIADSASVRARNDERDIVRDAQDQAEQFFRRANLCLWCVDASDSGSASDWFTKQEHGANKLALDSKKNLVAAMGQDSVSSIDRRQRSDLFVATKCDLIEGASDRPLNQLLEISDTTWIQVSSVTGQGIDRLRSTITQLAGQIDSVQTGGLLNTQARCRESLSVAERSLQSIVQLAKTNQVTESLESGHEFIAAEFRTCIDALGEVTGRVHTDDILDRVFSRFCIGK